MPSLGFDAATLAHEVGVHDPAVGLSGRGPDPLDVVDDFLELTRDQDLVRRTDIGAPKDVDVLCRAARACAALMPGITSYSMACAPLPAMASTIRIVLS